MKISYDSGNKERSAFRAGIPGLVMKVEGYSESFDVKDISAKGIAFYAEENVFELETQFEVDLILFGRDILLGLTVRAVRDIGKGLMGCIFIDIDKYQEERLDKLVLEIQKRMIQLRRVKGSSKV